ncbi:SusC/RagA family TonB-linked outer membrane protein [Kaistella antarctica]|uniref:Membrane protein n=1 Tax=Kaistella antarctica TaxID=266748 RepID=A0A3S4WRP5_9FLAO|nr:SusC/RagA family TonB-linked outer membrane protein [Kaistella antarctica]KEY19347.1 membrane protein [Kaistella antarctica]SEW05806.1 TonB-linked outer membrane protein, SusC/RagA family [Kaistella antarctica]VEH98393.1 Outer membrane cobalamin receptor protein [Kaistella antarctica]
MKHSNLRFPCLIAAMYFGISVSGQEVRQDTTLKEQKIEEVIVIGYGSAKKRDLTGTIAKVSGEEINDKPAANPVNSLQGKVAGLSIVNSGQPGSQADVRIRGTVTIGQTQPVYIVDGVFANNIDFLNPADIESMEILKDPSSLAIFGNKGANGAIIVTTKRGKTGRTTVNLSSSLGVKSMDNRPDITNAEQFKILYNEDLANQGLPAYDKFNIFNADTNWIDQIAKKGGIISQHNVTISNGSDKNRVSFSFGYHEEEGSIKFEDYSRMTLKFNDDLKISDKLRAGFGLTGSYAKLPQLSGFSGALNATPVVSPINMIPGEFYGLYNSLPQEIGAAQIANPLAQVEGRRYTQLNRNLQFNPNMYVEFDFFNNFTFRSNFFVNYASGFGRGYQPVFNIYIPETNTKALADGQALTSVSQYENRLIEFQQNQLLTYKNKFGSHDLTLMAGFETISLDTNSMSGSAKGGLSNPLGQIPNNPRFWYLNSDFVDSTTKTLNTGQSKRRNVSYFGRALYSFQNKYLLNASLRRDGSSALAPGNRFDTFWAVGGAWEVTKESFMENVTFLNYLKVKGSYGDLGNQNSFYNYFGYPVYVEGGTGVFNGNLYPAFIKEFEEASDLKWEHLKSYEFGFESMMLNRRLSLDAAYYNKQTQDLLNRVDGNPDYFLNAGSIEAKGFEFTAGWKDRIAENFTYYFNGNLTTTKTEVLKTLNDGYIGYFGSSIYQQGSPIGSFYGYQVEGIYQSYADILGHAPSTIGDVAPGDFKYRDLNGDGKISADDRTIIGDPTPDFTYGFSLGGDYKGWFLNADFYGVYGNEVYRSWGNGSSFAPFNYREERMDRWTGPGTSNWEPRSYTGSGYNALPSDYMIEDGSFFRIRNVQAGYNFNKDLISGLKLQALKLYVNVQNLKTWDHVNSFTPEFGGSAVEYGYNNSGYPNPRIASVGINATF